MIECWKWLLQGTARIHVDTPLLWVRPLLVGRNIMLGNDWMRVVQWKLLHCLWYWHDVIPICHDVITICHDVVFISCKSSKMPSWCHTYLSYYSHDAIPISTTNVMPISGLTTFNNLENKCSERGGKRGLNHPLFCPGLLNSFIH